ncbi:MAG: TetR/AcrR family transcriptional regulator [Thalassotalea sp.]
MTIKTITKPLTKSAAKNVSKETTKARILNAAEKLFANNGFNGTSLREITRVADVNLAAVNYHFGSKKELIKAVMSRYMNELSPNLSAALAEVCAFEQPSLTDVFGAFVQPLVSLNGFRENGAAIFLLLLGRGYSDSQGFLRWFLTTRYPQVIEYFVTAVKKSYPQLSQEDMFWRLHFTMGTVVFTMSSSEALIDIANNDYNKKVDITQIIEKIIPFVAAGVAAPITK